MLRWDTITPLGADVDPEVYCRNARASPSMAGLRQAEAIAPSASSLASHFSCCRSGSCAVVL